MAQSKSTAAQPATKPTTRVALMHLDESEAILLSDCFKQFKVSTVVVDSEAKTRMSREKFEGCVIRLDDDAEPILEAVRNSKSNCRMLIYGIAADTQSAMRFSRYSINAIFRAPLERQSALKVVRSTYLLTLHEYRRYVRIPLALEVVLDSDGRRITCLTEEISSGGMSLRVPEMLHGKLSARAKFTLPNSNDVEIKAVIAWRRDSDTMMGIRFDSEDKSRYLVRDWIDEFLQF
jgi:hypothetical protein